MVGIHRTRQRLFAIRAIATLSCLLYATSVAGNFRLDGIGYREQALQTAKTSFFSSEEASGINYASFNGGTNIFIKGPELNENPQSNVIFMESVELATRVQAPALTEDDAFASQPLLGHITYRLPSVHDLFGATQDVFDTFTTMTFYLSVEAPGLEEIIPLACATRSRCTIVYRKSYTPRVFYLSPPVVYYEAYTEVWFDPKSIMQVIQDLQSDETPFVNVELAGSKLDFEDSVDAETTFRAWYDNRARGQVGELPVGNNDSIKMLWEVGYAGESTQEITHCSYDNNTCYKVKTVPVIFNLSSNAGYTSGGQNLTIHGHGFESGNITVTVDGVNCAVTQYQEESVSCEVQAKAAPSVGNVPQLGSHGLRRRFVNESYHLNIASVASDSYAYAESLHLNFEVPSNVDDRIGHKLMGWFVAPATTAYRFYQTCDHYCRFDMGLNTSDPLTLTRMATRTWATTRRQYFRQWYDAKSDWVNLTAGEKYYVQGSHVERWGSDHMSVGVEIEMANSTGYHHAMKEVQYISAGNPNASFEVSKVTVDNVGTGTYKINFQSPNMTYVPSNSINSNSTAAEMRSAVYNYYASLFGSDVTVNRTMYLANGTNTTNATAATKHIFHIKLRRLISGVSAGNALISKSTTSTVTFTIPADV